MRSSPGFFHSFSIWLFSSYLSQLITHSLARKYGNLRLLLLSFSTHPSSSPLLSLPDLPLPIHNPPQSIYPALPPLPFSLKAGPHPLGVLYSSVRAPSF